jgi:hypothetical protein
MNEHDVVRVREIVMVTPTFENAPSKSKRAGVERLSPLPISLCPYVEFNEEYRGEPFLVDLDAANLEVVWESKCNKVVCR